MKSLALAITLASSLVVAQTTTEATTATTAAPVMNQTSTTVPSDIKEGDLKKIDQEITNNKMRAELGANKKYSFSAALGYSGGTVERPFSEVRPPIRSGLGARSVPATLAGTISARYKMNTNNSFSLNSGVSVITPFHGKYESNTMDNPVTTSNKKQIDRFTVAEPSLSYTYAGKLGELQSVSTVGATYYTSSSAVDDAGAVANLDFSQVVAGDFGPTTVGLVLGLSKDFYKSDLTEKQKDEEGLISLYMSPFAEYAFNDTFSFRTVFNYFAWDIAVRGEQGQIIAPNPQQSMGLGMAVTRDIYLYPNIQFMPFNARSDLTNVALSTTINL
jgi:hypothetical protein